MRNLLVFTILTLASFFGRCDVLYWSVRDDATVDGTGSVYSFLAPMPYDGAPDYNSCYGARVAVKNAAGTTLAYLATYYQTNPDETVAMYIRYELDPDIVEVDIGHPNEGYVGAEWNMSAVNRELLTEAVYFQVQLGHDVWNDAAGDYDWTTIAYSDNVDGKYLKDNHHTYEEFALTPPIELPWSPDNFYTVDPQIPVPEPSSWIVFILGFCMLTLKRKK